MQFGSSMKNSSGLESGTENTLPKEQRNEASIGKRFLLLLTQRWPEYVVEIIVVIIGITISFAISNYQQDSTDKKLAHIYLQDLREDIKSDIFTLGETIQQTDSVILSGQSLIAHSDSKISLTKQGLVDLVRSLIRRPNFTSKNATFSSLKTSANFRLIKDIELRKLLFEYDQDYQTIKAIERCRTSGNCHNCGTLHYKINSLSGLTAGLLIGLKSLMSRQFSEALNL